MPDLIDNTFFRAELNIGQSEQPENNSNLTTLRKKYEKNYLIALLGNDLYTDFMAGLLVDPIDSKWTDLKNALVDASSKESPIANYVYFFYQRNEVTQTVGVGEVTPDVLNGIIVSKLDKTRRSWNEMVNFNKLFLLWINANNVYSFVDPNSVYPSFNERFIYGKRRELYRVINSLNI